MSAIQVNGEYYLRIAIKTHVISKQDNICDVAKKYAEPCVREGDILFISEKAVACTQGRAIRCADVQPRRLATYLAKFVHKTPCGIGLGMPETMEMALRECGVLRIAVAAIASVIGTALRQKGWFYIIAGQRAAGIDGPCNYTLPPYNEYVVLMPKKPKNVARRVSKITGCVVAIVDINDLGGRILGCSHKIIKKKLLLEILADNPLGQGKQQTPMGIIRKAQK